MEGLSSVRLPCPVKACTFRRRRNLKKKRKNEAKRCWACLFQVCSGAPPPSSRIANGRPGALVSTRDVTCRRPIPTISPQLRQTQPQHHKLQTDARQIPKKNVFSPLKMVSHILLTSSHLKSFFEPAVPRIRLFLMITMMPLKRCVVKGNYFTALLRHEARNKFLMSGPWLSVAKLRPLSFAAARWGCLYLLL